MMHTSKKTLHPCLVAKSNVPKYLNGSRSPFCDGSSYFIPLLQFFGSNPNLPRVCPIIPPNKLMIAHQKPHLLMWLQFFDPKKNKVGQRTQKQDGTQHAFSWKSWGVASCALHEIDVRSLLKHRAHWWYQGPRFTTACCVSYAYSLLVAISVNVINSIPSV